MSRNSLPNASAPGRIPAGRVPPVTGQRDSFTDPDEGFAEAAKELAGEILFVVGLLGIGTLALGVTLTVLS